MHGLVQHAASVAHAVRAGRLDARLVAVGAEHAAAHPGVAGEVDDRHALQRQRQGCQQVKGVVQVQVQDARGELEKGNRATGWLGGMLIDLARQRGGALAVQALIPGDQEGFTRAARQPGERRWMARIGDRRAIVDVILWVHWA